MLFGKTTDGTHDKLEYRSPVVARGLLGVLLMRVLTALLVFLIAGCGLSEGGKFCPEVLVSLRDPTSGACHNVGACDANGNEIPFPDQASCGGSCEALSEADCVAVAGCRAAYIGGSGNRFLGCWGTAPSGQVHTGACAGLDAQTCSRHDNCSAWYVEPSPGTTEFDRCVDEPPAAP